MKRRRQSILRVGSSEDLHEFEGFDRFCCDTWTATDACCGVETNGFFDARRGEASSGGGAMAERTRCERLRQWHLPKYNLRECVVKKQLLTKTDTVHIIPNPVSGTCSYTLSRSTRTISIVIKFLKQARFPEFSALCASLERPIA